MASLAQVGTTGTTVRLSPMHNIEGEPGWRSPGVETWGSSTDDDCDSDSDSDGAGGESMDEIESGLHEYAIKIEPQTQPLAPVQIKTNRPKLSLHQGILASQDEWQARQRGSPPDLPSRQQGKEKPDPATAPVTQTTATTATTATTMNGSLSLSGKMETPVPLPLTATAAPKLGASSAASSGLAASALSKVWTPARKGSLATPTPVPVPLPLTARSRSSPIPTSDSTKSKAVKPVDMSALTRTDVPKKGQDDDDDDDDDDGVLEKSWHVGAPLSSTPSYQGIKPMHDVASRAIRVATDNRPYTSFPANDQGAIVGTRGVLIPKGYQLHDEPFPYICPLRDCQFRFTSLGSLGGHWFAAHSKLLLNDNHDGTLSEIGRYKSKHGSSPCIVITQKPLPANARPRAPARINDKSVMLSIKRKRPFPEDTGYNEARKQLNGSSQGLAERRRSFQYRRSEVSDAVAYLDSLLASNQASPMRVDIETMRKLPRKRDLPDSWIDFCQGLQLTTHEYACALAYIVGEEVLGADVCQVRQAKSDNSLLSERCIRPPQMDFEPLYAFSARLGTCVNCAFVAYVENKKNQCTLKRPTSSFTLPRFRASKLIVPPELTTGICPSPENMLPSSSSSSSSPSSSSEPQQQQQTLASQKPMRQIVLNRLQADREAARRKLEVKNSPLPVEPGTAVQPRADSIQHRVDPVQSGPVLPGQFGPPDFELEEWEIAPGRVASTDQSRNVAFSGAFLTSSTPITISPDVCFHVLTVRPGQTHYVNVHKDKMQVFSIASGKVKVTLGGQAVQLGPNGAFPVRPGDTCIIENRLYFEAVLHCTTVQDYEMSA